MVSVTELLGVFYPLFKSYFNTSIQYTKDKNLTYSGVRGLTKLSMCFSLVLQRGVLVGKSVQVRLGRNVHVPEGSGRLG